LLTAQKADLNHGEWLPWCRENLRFSERTMNNYLSVYRRRDLLKSAIVADLGLTEFYSLLSQPAAPDEPDEPEADFFDEPESEPRPRPRGASAGIPAHLAGNR
jgi:hypothetical protein